MALNDRASINYDFSTPFNDNIDWWVSENAPSDAKYWSHTTSLAPGQFRRGTTTSGTYSTGSIEEGAAKRTMADAYRRQRQYYDSNNGQNIMGDAKKWLDKWYQTNQGKSLQEGLDAYNAQVDYLRDTRKSYNGTNSGWDNFNQSHSSENGIYSSWTGGYNDRLRDQFAQTTFQRMANTFRDYDDLSNLRQMKYGQNNDDVWMDNTGHLRTGKYGIDPKTPGKMPQDAQKRNVPPPNPNSPLNLLRKGLKGLSNPNTIANGLEAFRALHGVHVNNKIAQRSIDAQRPYLQDPVEHHRAIYGNLRAQQEGQQAAAQLRSQASRPLTSDGALQTASQMEAQIKGQQYIDAGNKADDEMIRQTSEKAWEQEKENKNIRHEVAMENRKSLLQTERNIADIKNMRDSANWSQNISPWLATIEGRYRQKAAKQEAYDKYFKEKTLQTQLYNTPITDPKLAELEETRNDYINNPQNWSVDALQKDPSKLGKMQRLQQYINSEYYRSAGKLYGVNVPQTYFYSKNTSKPVPKIGEAPKVEVHKQGGHVTGNAVLQARSKNNDRIVKSINESKKNSGKFLLQTMKNLYRIDDVETVKTRKYDKGGGLPFVGFTPIAVTDESIPSSFGQSDDEKSSKSKKSGLIDDDIKSLLTNLDALPNDTNAIVNSLMMFEYASQIDPLGFNTSGIASKYYQLLGQIKIAKFNKEQYKDAFSQLKDDGALNEVAVSPNGMVITANAQGVIKQFTPTEINQGVHQKEGFQVLNNSNLLWLRQQSPNLAFDDGLVLSIAQAGTSMEKITKKIKSIINGLGTDKESMQGWMQTQNGQILQGIEYLIKAAEKIGNPDLVKSMTIDDFYQGEYLTESQAKQAQLALNYIASSLNQTEHALLQVKGGSPQGAAQLVQQLVQFHLTQNNAWKINPKKDPADSSGSGKKKGEGGIDDIEMDEVSKLYAGFGKTKEFTIQTGSAGTNAMKIYVQEGSLTNEDKAIENPTLAKAMSSDFVNALDFRHATMGGEKIDMNAASEVTLDDDKIQKTILPIDVKAKSESGIIKPNFDFITKMNQAEQMIRQKGLDKSNPEHIAIINQITRSLGLHDMLNPDGSLNENNFQSFGVLNGTASDRAFVNPIKMDSYLKETRDEKAIDRYERRLNQGRSKEDRVSLDRRGIGDDIMGLFGLSGSYDHIYQGQIFIPFTDDFVKGMSPKTKVKAGQMVELDTRQQIDEIINKNKSTFVKAGTLNE